MIKAVLQRPVSILSFSCVILGIITYFTLPVSLLPDIAIPEITVQVTGESTSARENTAVKPIVANHAGWEIRDIKSETRDGYAIIRLKFDYGTNTDLAFIEVNEKSTPR